MYQYQSKSFTPARDLEVLERLCRLMREGLNEASEGCPLPVGTWAEVNDTMDVTCWTFGPEGVSTTRYGAVSVARAAAVKLAGVLDGGGL